jgi:hypothetical protein
MTFPHLHFNGSSAPSHDDPGAYVMRWGEHTGRSLDQLPTGYLEWLAGECRNDHIRVLAREVLAERERIEAGDLSDDEADPFATSNPSDALARDVLPLLSFDFQQLLQAAYDNPEPGTPNRAAITLAVTILKSITSVYTGRCRPSAEQVAEAVSAALGEGA